MKVVPRGNTAPSKSFRPRHPLAPRPSPRRRARCPCSARAFGDASRFIPAVAQARRPLGRPRLGSAPARLGAPAAHLGRGRRSRHGPSRSISPAVRAPLPLPLVRRGAPAVLGEPRSRTCGATSPSAASSSPTPTTARDGRGLRCSRFDERCPGAAPESARGRSRHPRGVQDVLSPRHRLRAASSTSRPSTRASSTSGPPSSTRRTT